MDTLLLLGIMLTVALGLIGLAAWLYRANKRERRAEEEDIENHRSWED